MAYKNTTENFYREIIQKVCDQVKEDFHNEGVGEDVIQDLKKAWMDKLVQNGIFQRTMPNFLIKSYVDPGLIQGQGLMRTGHISDMRGNYYQNGNNSHTQPSINYFKSDPNKTTTDNINVYLEKRNITGSIASPYGGEIKQKFTTVNTLSNTQVIGVKGQMGNGTVSSVTGSGMNGINMGMNISLAHPQLTNPNMTANTMVKKDEDEDEVSDVDSDLEVFESKQKQDQVKKEEDGDLDEESLSSMSNDSEYVENEPKDILLAQYEKVHRVRNKWKCTFKDAVLHINGKEYVFEKVIGELERDW